MKEKAKNTLKYRLGLDLGTNSIGWCMLLLKEIDKKLEPVSVIKSGVRIFHDGRNEKSKEPLAVARRNARGMRRNLDRKISRRNYLLNTLIKYKLLPDNENERKALILKNPYELRAKAAHEKISLYELGRAIMHLSKRRGFKSNRKVDKKDDNGKIKPAIERLKNKMAESGKKTAGEYLYHLLSNGNSVRARLGKIGDKEGYEIYLDRSMIEEEYNIIMQKQMEYHEELSESIKEEICGIIVNQRDLKPQIVGKCSIFPKEEKMRKAHVLAQKFIYLQKIGDLRVYDDSIMRYRPLTADEKSILKRELNNKKEIPFDNIRKLLKKHFENSKYGMFSHEVTEKSLQGNKTNVIMKNKDVIEDIWDDLGHQKQYEIIELLFSNENDDDLKKLYREKFNLSEEQINGLLHKAIYKLDSGYMRYGKTAIETLVDIMDNENVDLYNAKEKADYNEKEKSETGIYETLEYYGKVFPNSVIDPQIDNPRNDEEKYGKIANPTVHIALNQLRKLVNELIKLYGKPEEIVIELARDLKNSRVAKDKMIKQNAENRKINEKVDKIIDDYQEKYHTLIRKDKLNRDKVKLWLELGDNELNRKCIYTGKQINIVKLFSDDVQVEHIVPYSKTLDDSMNNKTLSIREANNYKRNRTPYEAFKDNKDGYNYSDILARAKELNNESKYKRFTENAMEIYEKDGSDFIARQLTDTQYLSRIALQYLKSIYPEKNHSSLWSTKGQLTALIRHHLGLNTLISKDGNKNRNDHRHHAIDAFVIAITSRSMLQEISRASAKNELLSKIQVPEPFSNYRSSLKQSIDNVKTSHKPDRSISGKLHEDTAYGIVKDNDKNNSKYNVVTRWTIDKFKERKHYEKIRDSELRELALNNEEAFKKYVDDKKIKSIRILTSENPIIKIKNKSGQEYKAFAGGNNICVEIYEHANGDRDVEIISLYDASQNGFMPKWVTKYPEARIVMRLFKGDIIGYSENKRYQYYLIKGINYVANNLKLSPINQVGDEFRVGFKSLFDKKGLNAQQFNISITGVISKKKTPNPDFWKNRK